MKSISTRIEGRGQFVTYVEHGWLCSHKMRIKICLGGISSQSSGTIENWYNGELREVATIDGSALQVSCKAGYGRMTDVTFKEDRNALVRLAKEVYEDKSGHTEPEECSGGVSHAG